MLKARTLQDLFKRYRRPGDLFYSCICLAFSLFLALNLTSQTVWGSGGKILTQPALWPYLAVGVMTACSALHLVSSLLSEKIEGRWQEVAFWLRSFEFAGWFMVYVIVVPKLGYLPATIVFTMTLAFRLGYRRIRTIALAALFGIVVVIIFKSLLQVKVPGGEAYEFLPGALRPFFFTNF